MPTAPIVTDDDGKTWYVWDFRAKFAYPFDPDAPVFLLAAPPGGTGMANAPFLVKGDSGQPALISSVVDFTALAYDDATPDSAQFVEITPGTESTPQVSQLRLVLHKGSPGEDGSNTLVPADYGTPIPKQFLALDAGGTQFVYAPQRVGNRYWASSISEAGAGTSAAQTLATVGIPANTFPFPYQLAVSGTTIVTGSGTDVKVDLIARLNSTTGTVLGRGYGVGGTTDRITLCDGPDYNASALSVTIASNSAATVYFRAEKQSGLDTYQTGASPSRFCVTVIPMAP